MSLSRIPQYTIRYKYVHISVRNDLLWDTRQVPFRICEIGLFPSQRVSNAIGVVDEWLHREYPASPQLTGRCLSSHSAHVYLDLERRVFAATQPGGPGTELDVWPFLANLPNTSLKVLKETRNVLLQWAHTLLDDAEVQSLNGTPRPRWP